MMKQEIKLESYDWIVLISLIDNKDDLENIVKELIETGCDTTQATEIYDYFADGKRNKGVTYTNIPQKSSFVLIGKTTSLDEFINTITHELFHVVVHICSGLGIDLESEEPCYIMGKLCQSTI